MAKRHARAVAQDRQVVDLLRSPRTLVVLVLVLAVLVAQRVVISIVLGVVSLAVAVLAIVDREWTQHFYGRQSVALLASWRLQV